MPRICLVFALAFLCQSLYTRFVVTGRIINSEGNPLIRVNVSEKGTLNVTVSDVNGSNTLTLQYGASILISSYTGYQTIESAVDGRKSLDILMQEGISLSEVRVVGSRSYRRSSTDSPVPIDVIDINDFGATYGKVEINQMLQYSAPSFNATKQSGADHIDPASLRGLGPDQTLVLVKGKRRHQSSLINVFGTRGRGNSGTDLNALPSAALRAVSPMKLTAGPSATDMKTRRAMCCTTSRARTGWTVRTEASTATPSSSTSITGCLWAKREDSSM